VTSSRPSRATTVRKIRFDGSVDVKKDLPTLDSHWIGSEIDAYWCPLSLTRAIVKAAIVLGTLDDVAHHEAVGELNLLVGTKPVSSIVFVLWRAVDCESLEAVVESKHIFPSNVFNVAGFYPIRHVN
jgi:hypothetical protein